MSWIDTHVHLFPESYDHTGLPRFGGKINTPANYCAATKAARPSASIVVHFSKAPDSAHVIGVLDDSKKAKCPFPVLGVIKADVNDPRTFDWIIRPDVKAVRIYAKESMPDFSNKAAWDRLFNLVRSGKKHLVVFGEAPFLRPTLAKLPSDIPVVIDHLGLPDVDKGANGFEFATLLAEMKSRVAAGGEVYFKGPGYRSSLDAKKVQPFINAIVSKLGVERLMLGASDGPFAGPVGEKDVRFAGKNFSDIVNYDWVNNFTTHLAEHAATALGMDKNQTVAALLHDNAKIFYGL